MFVKSQIGPRDKFRLACTQFALALTGFSTVAAAADPFSVDLQFAGESALRGKALFFSETAECYHCHQGLNFTDTLQTARSGFAEVAFYNTIPIFSAIPDSLTPGLRIILLAGIPRQNPYL